MLCILVSSTLASLVLGISWTERCNAVPTARRVGNVPRSLQYYVLLCMAQENNKNRKLIGLLGNDNGQICMETGAF